MPEPKNVLVVEDEQAIRRIIAEALREEGYTVLALVELLTSPAES